MIEIYNKDNFNLESNGDITLEPISCIYKTVLNEIKELTLEHNLDDIGRWKYIKEDSLIAVSREEKKKFYRIYNIVKSLDTITAYARPLFYDLIDSVLLDVRPTDKTAEEALNIILQNTKFRGHSNISKVNTAYYIRKNILEAITSNDENSFLNRWGGEIYLDNYDIYVNDKIGSDNGVRVEFGYNLNAIEEDVNLDTVTTRIIPTGFNGIMLDGPTPWVDSKLINKYVNIKCRVINFDDIKVKENPEDEDGFNTIEEAREELRNRCLKLYEGGIDKPTINYKIDMVNLAETTLYKAYKVLEEVDEGDTVTCKIDNLDIDVSARCIKLERDEITGELISLELGNVISNYFNQQVDITDRVNSILSDLDLRLNEAITPGGAIRAEKIQGFINGTKAKLKASRDIAQKQEQRVIEFEDLDINSPTYGSTILGTQGIFVADTKDINNNWDYSSALTAKGLVANMLYGKILAGTGVFFDLTKGEVYFNKGLIQGSNSSWNLDTGEFKSSLPDGSEIIISPTSGFYQKVGSNKREYYNLSYNTEVDMNNGTAISGSIKTMVITLPEEFRGKKFSVSLSIKRMESPVDGGGWFLTYYSSYIRNKDYNNGTFEIYANMHWHRVDSNNQITIGKVTYPELIIDVTA